MVNHSIPRGRGAAIGAAVRRTLRAFLGGELGVLAHDREVGEHLARELAESRLAIVSTEVEADIAADLPRLPRPPITARAWAEIERARSSLTLAIAECEERLRVLDEIGHANEAAAQFHTILDAAAAAVGEIA